MVRRRCINLIISNRQEELLMDSFVKKDFMSQLEDMNTLSMMMNTEQLKYLRRQIKQDNVSSIKLYNPRLINVIMSYQLKQLRSIKKDYMKEQLNMLKIIK
ncbi:Hypothetical_protein [Hexamita inflata]|uniref:Hypothetical_protein n=1 Tax=Hexamita inflata TaxID=28002 RepID=A0AA86QTG2_9EUKA|nr:Hypothetical protein HINF_LOCUS53359 [Hexamita inflata]